MSFYETLNRYKGFDFNRFFSSLTSADIEKALRSTYLRERDFLALLSPKAEEYIEDMAQASHRLTLQNFGKAIVLYTPLYLSNYCENRCIYCGFNAANIIKRKTLSMAELEKEAEFIASTGLRNILILTGGSRRAAPVSYIKKSVKVLKDYFSSICVEVYALTEEEYKELIDAGIDGLTIYQETYGEDAYNRVHLAGKKRDYGFRLDAPERALNQNIRTANIGVLFGLDDWRKDAFFTGLHAAYLQNKFLSSEISVSVPRLRPQVADFKPFCDVADRDIVQFMAGLRIFLPRVGITLSTREPSSLRHDLLPLGITKMSAGSTTAVGGHTTVSEGLRNSVQFDIADERSVSEIRNALLERGYQPVLKDWMHIHG